MRRSVSVALAACCLAVPLHAAPSAPAAPEDAVLRQERALATAVRRHDFAAFDRLLSDGYFFTEGQGGRLRIASKTTWLGIQKTYDVASFAFDDARVRIYGTTAVVTMLATERATVAAVDRTSRYFITDIWVQEDGAWRIAERHSSRPDPAPGRSSSDQ
jgi:hypothetical protein